MSFAAVYNVTRALRMLLHSQLAQVSPGAVVTLLPPGDNLPAATGVNLYLYRVAESPAFKNLPWPGDRATPPGRGPALALQLSYLLTPLGTKPEDASFELGDDAHTMLGLAMSALHEHPILNDIHVPGFDADTVLPPFVLNSYEQIKVTLLPTNVDELSKIWATINQPYRLSVAYEVSLVEVIPAAPPPVNGGVVLSTGVNVITLDAPRLASLAPATGALAHVAGGALAANTLAIGGFGFSFPGQAPLVRVGGQLAPVQSSPPPTGTSLTVALPLDLDAGPQADVRVSVNGRASTPLAFTVTPWIAEMQPIRTALDPTHPADLKLTLAGNGFTASPQAVRFDGPGGTTAATAFDPGGSDTRAVVAIPAALVNGLYQVRLVLNDAPHNASNARTLEVLPRVDAPVTLAVVTVSGNNVHQLTINGARLNGGDVRLALDGSVYQAGSNANPNQLVYTLGRLLSAGAHSLAVQVNGQSSRTVAVEV